MDHALVYALSAEFIMAPNLPKWRHGQIQDMINAGYNNAEIAEAAECSRNAVSHIRTRRGRKVSTSPYQEGYATSYVKLRLVDLDTQPRLLLLPSRRTTFNKRSLYPLA